MKLGSETGSVINNLYSRAVIGQPEPQVGMGVTVLGWTDRHPGTIVKIEKAGKYEVITVQEDKSKVISGTVFDGSAQYEYAQDTAGRLSHFRFRNNRWEEIHKSDKGRWVKSGGYGLRLGQRERYYDPHF